MNSDLDDEDEVCKVKVVQRNPTEAAHSVYKSANVSVNNFMTKNKSGITGVSVNVPVQKP